MFLPYDADTGSLEPCRRNTIASRKGAAKGTIIDFATATGRALFLEDRPCTAVETGQAQRLVSTAFILFRYICSRFRNGRPAVPMPAAA